MKISTRFLLFFAVAASLAVSPRRAGADIVLWYNGDLPSNGGATANEVASSPVGAMNSYDDFVVTDPGGWTIHSLFANNQMNVTGVTQASWIIRSGASVGNGGSVVASGTSAATQTATGRVGGATSFAEYTINATGLNVTLGPGTYWLAVSPLVGNDTASGGLWHSYLSATVGSNAVNRPASPVGNGLFDSTYLGYNFANFGNDYSMGMTGVAAIPEPSTLLTSALALLAIVGYSRVRRPAATA